MNEIILKRHDLKRERMHTQIQHIDSSCFLLLSSYKLMATADRILFVDNNKSYKILKDRSASKDRIIEWADILCLQCERVFNAYNEKDIASCPRCNCAGNLFYRSGNFTWVGWCIK